MGHSEISTIEDEFHRLVGSEIDKRCQALRDAGLSVELEPLHRDGVGASYASYIEAVFRYEDGDVHDVLFFYIAREGHLVIMREPTTAWVVQAVDEIVGRARTGDE